MTRDDVRYALTGSGLSETEAAALETRVEQNPADVDARLKLLGYYAMRRSQDTEAAARRVPHILWLIEHQPEREDLFRAVACASDEADRGDEPTLTPLECRELAERALAHFERALALARSPRVRFQLLSHCAEAALESEQWSNANRYADEILALAPQPT